MKPETNTFSKYCKDNKKNKSLTKYTQIIRGPYDNSREKNCAYYESFLNVRNSATE